MKVKIESLCKAIIRADWTREELALLKEAIKSCEERDRSESEKTLREFPYARLVGVTPKSACGKVVAILAIRRGMVTFKLYDGDGTIRRLPLKYFEPLCT